MAKSPWPSYQIPVEGEEIPIEDLSEATLWLH